MGHRIEDFAEAVAAYCFPTRAAEKAGGAYKEYRYTPRGQYIGKLMTDTAKGVNT